MHSLANRRCGTNLLMVDETEGSTLTICFAMQKANCFGEGSKIPFQRNEAPFRLLACPVKLLFHESTSLEPLEDSVVQIPRHVVEFVKESILRSRANNSTILLDIVDCYLGSTDVETIFGDNKRRHVNILTDFSVTIIVTLWGNIAEVFDPSLYTEEDAPHVIVVTSVLTGQTVRINSTKGNINLFNISINHTSIKLHGAVNFATTHALAVYMDPDSNHVASVRDRFSSLSNALRFTVGSSPPQIPLHKQLVTNRMTVKNFAAVMTAGKIHAQIIGIDNKAGWFYTSCKVCLKEISAPSGGFIIYESVELNNEASKSSKEASSNQMTLPNENNGKKIKVIHAGTDPVKGEIATQ
ncbi:hypothetical protein AG4045_019373 [Apium graveolens]|uniref:Replication protein A OB domain-containing protein n=1 Tax=Apium graveolens TaxID=4045 RepID=A0A6L5B8C1_APIGR|nr:hypothetical protein AG4045_019373 [Apium graveolens]